MKRLAAAFMVSLGAAAIAASDQEREFQKLTQERNAAIAAAAEPINRRYQAALEPLLRRATQSNDLETAIKIREALQAFDGKEPVLAPVTDSLASRLVTTTWKWWEAQTITFEARGKVRWSNGQTWTWKPGGDGKTIKGETATGQGFTIRFNSDLKTGTIEGAVNGETHLISK